MDDKVEAEVIAQHEALIHKLAWKAEVKLPPDSLDHDDLFQEGVIVALKAFRCYKPKMPVREGPYVPGATDRGAKLSTYITVSIVNRYKRLTNREWSRFKHVRLSGE